MDSQFKKSLNPILKWMMIFGIRVEYTTFNSYYRYFQSICILITTTCIVMINYYYIKDQKEIYSLIIKVYDDKNKSLEERKHGIFSCVFPFVNDAVIIIFSTGPYLILLILMMNGNLKRMWASLIKVEKAFQPGQKFHMKVKTECYKGLALIILDTLLEICSEIAHTKRPNSSYHLSYTHTIGTAVSVLSGANIRTLFFVFATIANFFVEELVWKIEDSLSIGENISKEEEQTECDVESVRRLHDIICTFVDQINENFGFILLINLTWIFYTSLCTFSDMLVSYAFIVIVSGRFDLQQMSFDLRVVEMSYGKISLKHTRAPYPYDYSRVTSELLKSYYNFHINSLVSMVRSTLVFLTIWIRLLIIVVSSARLWKQGQCLFDTFRRFSARRNEQLLLQIYSVRLQLWASAPFITAANVKEISQHFIPLLIATTIDYGVAQYDMVHYAVLSWKRIVTPLEEISLALEKYFDKTDT